ncbi:M28 family peptidase [Solimonas marina]|uniref:M28 family peptidase n=1 Tax=Solimonas marina TaxID=2714601 RepID=A0A969W7F8_9GAMM|nr:M28 family peptidase [Solimonas marina]NKF20883.1 M28 family peptidase [Solimonas marina]
MIRTLTALGAASLLLLSAGCSHKTDNGAAAKAADTQADVKTQADPQQMSDTVKTLASDPFEGRAPGTPGETKTVDYLVQRFKAMGLEPGGPDGQYTQKVPLINTQIGKGTLVIDDRGAKPITLTQGDNVSVTTVRPDSHIDIKNAPMVFVGYGVDAPDVGWNDYKNVDLHGKVAVYLVNDPDFKAQPSDDADGKFGGKRMTYYGRWTYKFAEAARRGAVAALIVHDTDAAGYPWQTVAANQGANSDIVRAKGDEGIPLQGWLSHEQSDALFKAAGLDLDKLRVEARSAKFQPVALKGMTLTADLPVTSTTVQSQNVIAKLPGKTHPDETILYGAHWDAYGVGAADAQGRTIRAGANDDGLGDAGVLELARLFKAAPQPDRTVVFAIWTAEERGLLGSEYYATHPVYPIAKTVADMTMDILQTAGPAKNVVEVGMGNSSLDGYMKQAAEAQGRTVEPETFVERGLFYRADHFSLAKQGVPSLLLMALGGAPDLVDGGKQAGQKWLDAYMKCYHQTCDTWSKDWDLRGAAQDVDVFYDIGKKLANSREWPTWNDGVAFKKTREATADQRQ